MMFRATEAIYVFAGTRVVREQCTEKKCSDARCLQNNDSEECVQMNNGLSAICSRRMHFVWQNIQYYFSFEGRQKTYGSS